MTDPLNPIAAVTHPDPYAYYAQLVATKPLYYDQVLGLWVASSAAMVSAILNHSLCRVRPVAEPIPTPLLGSPAAEIFRQLVRMNDGAGHCPFKQAVSSTLLAVDLAHASAQSQHWARVLAERYVASAGPEQRAEFAFQLSVYVVGSLLGVPAEMLDQVALWVGDFVRCLVPTSSPEQIERGKVAAAQLLDTFRSLFISQPAETAEGLLFELARAAKRVGRAENATIIANGIGFLSQAYEATAGLIGNTLLALDAHAEVRRQVAEHPELLRNAVQEVLRYDPPVQNTRRFLAEDASIAGQAMRAGDTILLVLAAANRDPLLNPSPAQFDLFRQDRRSFTFGLGPHACPGDALATTIAAAGVAQLLASNVLSRHISASVTYRPSANTRIPMMNIHS